MIAKDYRVLKAKGVTEIQPDGTYLRPLYDQSTGEVVQTRSDIVDDTVILERRTELIEEIADIDEFLTDFNAVKVIPT